MQEKLIINNIARPGICLMDDSSNALFSPLQMKDYVENESRLEHGKHIVIDSPLFSSRDVNVVFGIKGKDKQTFYGIKNEFINLLYQGEITLEIPQKGTEVFHLIYRKSISFSESRTGTFCKIACKFTEANPDNRKNHII